MTVKENKCILNISNECITELANAMTLHDSMKSSHEGYAVLLEEVDELWDVVKSNPRKLSDHNARMREEAIQVAAMAIRFVIDVCDKEKE
jgi:NTP pyrophosphatase (non-canonical NTP hydrolase)